MLIRITHIILAFLLFISSTGLVFNKHYCQNKLQSIALFLPAKGCHREMTKADCPMHGHGKVEKKGCCNDKTDYLKAQEDQMITTGNKLVFARPSVTWSPIIAPFRGIWPSVPDKQTLHYLNYKPPLIVCDLPVRFQIFLC